MTEWGVVLVITVLIGLLVSVTTPIIKLTKTIADLTAIVRSLGDDMTELTSRNSATHARLFAGLGKHDDKLAEHETRITILEHEKGK